MRRFSTNPRHAVFCAGLLTMGSASCGTSSGGAAASAPDGGDVQHGHDAAAPDASSHPPPSRDSGSEASPMEAATPHVNVDVCGAASGTVAWVGSIASSSSALDLSDVAVGPTNDVVVGDELGSATYEQRRWDEKGTFLSVHQDAKGAYVGPSWVTNLFIDSQNDVFYGTLFTGSVDGKNSTSQLGFTVLSPEGTSLYSASTTSSMPTSDGKAKVLVFTAGDDPGGGLHGPLTMANPQYFSPGVYCYPPDLSSEATSAQTATGLLGKEDFEWPSGGNLYLTKSVTSSTNLGCGDVSVPAGGGIVLAELDGGGGCMWSKLLALPVASVKATNFRVGGDGSLTLAVVYSGSIDFGGGSLTSMGTSALAIARFDGGGNLGWTQNYSGAGWSFTLGSLSINATGMVVVSSGYAGTVNLGGGVLPSTADTVIAVLDASGHFKWNQPVEVGTKGQLKAAIGSCGVAVATNSPSVDLGTGPLSTVHGSDAPSIGVAALGL
jgi:hypothetical protein